MIQQALDMIRQFLNGAYDPMQFSLDMEEFLNDQYDAMHEENPNLTEFLNEDIPELCAECEPGMDFTEFRQKIEVQMREALAYL